MRAVGMLTRTFGVWDVKNGVPRGLFFVSSLRGPIYMSGSHILLRGNNAKLDKINSRFGGIIWCFKLNNFLHT